MVSGFLVRDDGSMISVDHIGYIERAPLPSPGHYMILIHLRSGTKVTWGGTLTETEAAQKLNELRELIQKAIEY